MSDRFPTVRTEGAILPADLLQRIAAGDNSLNGLAPSAYHLIEGEKLNEATNRAWNRLQSAWASFRAAWEKLSRTDLAVGTTWDRWLLPLFQELGYGRLQPLREAFAIEDKYYPISHVWGHAPIHLVGGRMDLDKRVAGSPSSHSLVQEFLNRSEAHLWGFVSNGLKLRILRDNIRLTRQAFVEFDLQAMFDGKVYADFALLWRLCHQSRVEAEKSQDCWLEQWSKAAQQQGLRVLDELRGGVEQAIAALGSGFLSCPSNQQLRDRLRAGKLDAQDYYRQLLRLVYRLLFLFVAEDRELLFDPQVSDAARDRYCRFYSTARLRQQAERLRGTQHTDLYYMLSLVMAKLGSATGCPELGLPALGSFLFSPEAVPDLEGCQLTNADLLATVRALALTSDGQVRRPVDYRNLGSEELGSIYESLLELHPVLNSEAGTFELRTASGHERKTTGTYYTPKSLITCLLDSALDPVLDEAVKQPDPEAALLNLKICDPACGSGHFLIAAAHRLAKRLAFVRTGEAEPPPEAVRSAVRAVIGRCIYGVDVNPMAVELCKVALWMEALVPGKPLSFLDHHIQCGNSLLGATPALLAKGIPEDAFEPIEGDDKALCRGFKRQNRDERRGQRDLFDDDMPWNRLGDLAGAMQGLDQEADDTVAGVQRKQERYADLVRSSGYLFGRLWADAWCAAFVWRKDRTFDYAITESIFRKIERSPFNLTPWMRDEIQRLAEQYQFFHWHLAFPDVFSPRRTQRAQREAHENVDSSSSSALSASSAVNEVGWTGGFDVVLGNPPWERIKLQEQEWFAAHGRLDIAGARTAAIRGRMIKELETSDPALHRAFLEDRRKAEGESHLVRDSSGFDEETGRRWGMYPLCGRGDVNTYSLFAELNRNLINRGGRVGCILPTGIATDDTNKLFFQELVEDRLLVSFYAFENEEKLFPGVTNKVTFGLLCLGHRDAGENKAKLAFRMRRLEHIEEEGRLFDLDAADLALLNPNTRTCPVFRAARDAVLTKAIYRRVPLLFRESPEANPWGIRFLSMFHMANDSGLFRTAKDLHTEGWKLDGNTFRKGEGRFLPLYEGKMFWLYNHRFGDYAAKRPDYKKNDLPQVPSDKLSSPTFLPMPQYWIDQSDVDARLEGKWPHQWLLAWRDVTGVETLRTCIASALPRVGVGHKAPLVFSEQPAPKQACLYANLCSFALDYVARQKVGRLSLTLFLIKQFAVLTPSSYDQPCLWSPSETVLAWLLPRVVELTYTAWDLQPFGADCGFDGPPFRWDEERRFQLRCELDAAYFHLYLGTGDWEQVPSELAADFAKLKEAFPTPRHAVEHIMGTFPLVRKADEEEHGQYRTKANILTVYDALADAARTGQPYQTRLDPPPADPRVAHPPRQPQAALTAQQLDQLT